MGKFVPQRAIDLFWMCDQTRVQRNQFLAIIRAAGGGSETRLPFDANLLRNALCA
jgi:hypothetical protein